jgi:hypothetical protein
MAAKFHERFDIEIDLEEARRRFVNRAHALVFKGFWSKLEAACMVYSVVAVAFELGDELKGNLDIGKQVGMDFFRNLQGLEALYKALSDQDVARENLENLIHRLCDASEVDLGIRWEHGQFVRSGAALLDESLVNDPLLWLRSSGYETVRTPFEKGLNYFLHASKRPELLADVVTDMYEALEALAKILTNRPDKDLSGNRELFLSKVKASEDYKQLLKDYIEYANKFRHAVKDGQSRPALSPKEVESFVYLTGLFIRLAIPSE